MDNKELNKCWGELQAIVKQYPADTAFTAMICLFAEMITNIMGSNPHLTIDDIVDKEAERIRTQTKQLVEFKKRTN